MESMYDKDLNSVVSEVILDQKGKFTIVDIINQVNARLTSAIENLKNYIIDKLNLMCEYGLVGRTDIYYFLY